ncbi:hypothetical protein [Microbacterium sp.]|uniref:hypothetical protein n=1 Tax=Microbacterium sp. TaxID=51671 RepID=UPI0039E6F6F2
MPIRIDVAGARALLRTREDVMDGGLAERQVQHLVESGVFRKIRRGRYVFETDWAQLWPEGKHLVQVVAARLNAVGGGHVFWGPSAAVLLGIPLYRLSPKAVHVGTVDRRHGRTRAGITWHYVDIPDSEIVEIDGIRCTSLDRTILDLARSTTAEAALAAADAALRAEAVRDGQVQDGDAAGEWRERMSFRARREHGRGIVRARWTIEFADGRAQLPGESVSRYRLYQLGFSNYDIQVPVVGATGNLYWLDFAFVGMRCFGEFDGLDKYTDAALRGERTAQEVVLDEKRREDDIRGVTGWRLGRWGLPDIATPDAFSAKLSAFGIRPPG